MYSWQAVVDCLHRVLESNRAPSLPLEVIPPVGGDSGSPSGFLHQKVSASGLVVGGEGVLAVVLPVPPISWGGITPTSLPLRRPSAFIILTFVDVHYV